MNKDIIYIDVDDDITAVISKVKDAKEKIVALVPPKRIGILQSAVNLRLLSRAAEQSGKRLVLISNNSALLALASVAKIPVAKNLQSKPAMAEIPALEVDDGEDVIDGAQLPVGELAKTADNASADAFVSDPAIDEAVRENAAETSPRALPPAPGQALRRPRPKSGVRVPNFDVFRKRLALIIGGGVLLVVFLIWAIFFAGHATILITARTADASVNPKVAINTDATTSMANGTLKAVSQQVKKDVSLSFTPTGSKDVGDKAKGQVVFQNCESLSSETVPSGTVITANGNQYVTQEDATVPGGTGDLGICTAPGKSDPVAVTASDIGSEYNTPSGTTFSVAGHPNSSSSFYFNAVASSDVSGGSKKQVKVVTDQDVQKAIDQLSSQSSDDVKSQLAKQFGGSVVTIDQSFKADRSGVKSSPAVGAEASDGTAKLTGSVVYTMLGVDKSEIGRFLDDYLAKTYQDKADQRVYDNGADKASFTDLIAAQSGYSGTLVATAQVGPKIDDTAIKNESKGKRYGEIQSSIESINGVDNVDVKFSPFWVSKVPNDTNRIKVEFKLNESK